MAGELGLEKDQDESSEEKGDGGMADWKEVEAEEAEEDEEGSNGPRDDGAGDVELEVDEKTAEDQEEDGDVWVGEAAEDALPHRWRGGGDDGVVEVQGFGGAVEAVDLAIVEGCE